MSKPSKMLVLKIAFTQSLREMVLLPVWWYTRGLAITLGKLIFSIKDSVRFFSVDIWAKNLLVPMYGDESFFGRILSFCVRLVVLAIRFLGVVAWSLIAILLALLYIVILPLVIIGFFSHMIGLLLFYA